MPSPLRFVTTNWQLKALALALALLLWVVVSAEQVTSQWIPVPLRIEENDPDYELVQDGRPSEVEVRFTGSGRDLIELAIRKPPLVLSVSQVQGATQEFRLDPGMVQVPNQLAVSAQEVRAPLVRLNFRRLSLRLMTISPSVDTDVGSGWTLVDTLRIVPAQVELRGPAERVGAVGQVRTMPFVLPASDSVFSTVVRIDTTNLDGVELSTTQVEVSGRVDRVVQRRLADVPVSAGAGVRLVPGVVDVVLSGARSVVEQIQPAQLRVVMAIDSIPERIAPEGLSVPLRIEQLRSGVSASVVPPAVRLMPTVAAEDSAAAEDTAESQLPGEIENSAGASLPGVEIPSEG